MHPQAPRRSENLAFVFQELLTVGERLRSNRQQVADAASFRAQIWSAVRQADEEARRRGKAVRQGHVEQRVGGVRREGLEQVGPLERVDDGAASHR